MSFKHKFLEFATIAHNTKAIGYHNGFQTRWNGSPYINHPIAVEKNALKIAVKYGYVLPWQLEIVSSVSYTHDVDEDTNITYEDWENLFLDIRRSGINIDYNIDFKLIRFAVGALTKRKENFDLFEYLDGIKRNPYALSVKLADLEHNMSDLKDKKKLEKYKLIEYYLTH